MRSATSQFSAPARQSGTGAGLTLFELLLVMAIIVMVNGFSIPAIEDSLKARDMEDAGEFVRQKLSEGRTQASETGFVYQFRYEPGAGRFVILPDLGGVTEGPDGTKYYRFSGSIGSTIRFQEEIDSPGMGETLDREWFEGLPDALELSRTGWSKPVEFTFEGSADDSKFFLLDDANRSIKVRIRGLTGGTNVSKVSWEAVEK